MSAPATLARVAPVIDLDRMRRSRVVLVGAGTGGSRVATELARCGVGGWTLIDPDEVKPENVSRHVAGLRSVGRAKVDAVRDAILDVLPDADVAALRADALAEPDVLRNALGGADLVVEATGRASVAHLVSRLATDAGVPATFGGVYARGIGGYAMRYAPGSGDACYTCVFSRLRALERAQNLTPAQVTSYTDADGEDELVAEPSLSLHVWYVALLQTRLSLGVLVGEGRGPAPIDGSIVLWANEPWGGIFTKPLTYKVVIQAQDPECFSCGGRRRIPVESGNSAAASAEMPHHGGAG